MLAARVTPGKGHLSTCGSVGRKTVRMTGGRQDSASRLCSNRLRGVLVLDPSPLDRPVGRQRSVLPGTAGSSLEDLPGRGGPAEPAGEVGVQVLLVVAGPDDVAVGP